MTLSKPFSTLNETWLLIIASSFAMFTVSYNGTAIMNSLVIIKDQLGLSANEQQWAANIYMLFAASFIILGGQLGDRYGRKQIFIAGASLFGLASLIIAASQDINTLIAGRALQGIGAALIAPGSLALLKANLAQEKISTGISVWTASIGLGLAVGPTAGGIIAELSSWRFIFMSIIIFLAPAVAIIYQLPNKQELIKSRFDFLGLSLLIGGLLPLMTAFMQAKVWGLTSPYTLSLLTVGTLLLVLFVRAESRTENPLVHLTHFKHKTFIASNISNGVTFGALISSLFFFNVYFQSAGLMHLSPLNAGLALLPMSIAMFAITFISNKLTAQYGLKKIITVNLLAMAALFFWFALINSHEQATSFIAPLALLGITTGIGLSAAPTMGLKLFQPAQAGEASGILNTANYLSAVFVVAIAGILFQWGHLAPTLSAAEVLSGFKHVMLFIGALALFGSIACYRLIETPTWDSAH